MKKQKWICNFLECGVEDTLIVVHRFEDRDWGLCAFHDRIVSKNGATVVSKGGNDYLFSPVMSRGTNE